VKGGVEVGGLAERRDGAESGRKEEKGEGMDDSCVRGREKEGGHRRGEVRGWEIRGGAAKGRRGRRGGGDGEKGRERGTRERGRD